MEENLANRSRAELETALLDSGRALQATLAAQLRGFDGEGLRGRRTLTAGGWALGDLSQ